MYVAVTSPVGQHIVTGVQGLSNGSGTGGYRVQIAQQYSKYWTFLGGGITLQNLDLGYNVDLGIPNTILVLGFLGAGSRCCLLLAAVGRGLLAKSTVGIAFAAVIVMVLLARPTLPFLETGPGAVAYGMTLGAIAALYLPRGYISRTDPDLTQARRPMASPRRRSSVVNDASPPVAAVIAVAHNSSELDCRLAGGAGGAARRPGAPRLETCVVDNGSRPDELRFLREHVAPRVDVLVESANVGFGRGCNAGAAVTQAPS